MKMAEETIYLCNFRVSVDGDWLCLRELSDVQLQMEPEPMIIDEGEFQPAVLPPGGFSQHAARACALGAGRWASTPGRAVVTDGPSGSQYGRHSFSTDLLARG